MARAMRSRAHAATTHGFEFSEVKVQRGVVNHLESPVSEMFSNHWLQLPKSERLLT